ncbi:MAG: HAD family hydrolase [Candidatus Omnitrophica bacterium]|nr:HAD family hydrolase [Candidatus Omnitrophota bacterium]
MDKFKTIKELVANKSYTEAFELLKQALHKDDDFIVQHKAALVWKNFPKQHLDLKKIKVSVLSSSTTSHLLPVLDVWLAKNGLNAQLWESEFDTFDQMIIDSKSDLYKFNPEIVFILINYRDIDQDVENRIAHFQGLWDLLQQRLDCFVIQSNVDVPLTRIMGNYEAVLSSSNQNLLRKFNSRLGEAVKTGVTVFDLEYIAGMFGKKQWFDNRYWYHSKHAFNLEAIGLVAFYLSRLIAGVKGLSKKCLVLDLDNTLWGGVIGDDGINGIILANGAVGEAFVDFQKYIRGLKERGIILTICSKNEELNAKEPFLKHPEMILKLDDIAVFNANWNNKADNICSIAETLNIGLDSMVFIDDNPAERELVRSILPQVTVVDMPEDPADYIRALDEQALFETIAFSDEDRIRNDFYRDNSKRQALQKQFTDLNEYLKSLEMSSVVGDFDEVNLGRIAQLINKSNQFNLTTNRYTEVQIKSMMNDPAYSTRFFRLKDRLGDNGLISAVILKDFGQGVLGIDTWVMSCRVLSRGMEEFIFNEIISLAKTKQYKSIQGQYIPTKKNGLVADLLKNLGFVLERNENGVTWWHCEVSNVELKKVHIKKENYS